MKVNRAPFLPNRARQLFNNIHTPSELSFKWYYSTVKYQSSTIIFKTIYTESVELLIKSTISYRKLDEDKTFHHFIECCFKSILFKVPSVPSDGELKPSI